MIKKTVSVQPQRLIDGERLQKILCACLVGTWLLGALSGCVAAVATGAVTGATLLHDRRTTGTIVDDHGLELKAEQAIRDNQGSAKLHVSILSYNNNVLLVGQAPSEEKRLDVENAVRDLDKVRRIYNEIKIADPTPLSVRSQDAWITTKVKSNLMFNDRVDGSRIKVLTENGVVYLIGIVTAEEDEAAVDLARRVEGVQKVVKLFEYTS